MAVTAIKPSSPAPDGARIVHADTGYVMGVWDRHIIAIWRREISAPGVATWSRAMAELQKQHPGQRINVIVYIEPECLFADSPITFEACVDAGKRFESVMAATAIIYNREGFWSATMRGRFTAIHNESKVEPPYAMHPSLAGAIEWLGEHGARDLAINPQALELTVEALRRA